MKLYMKQKVFSWRDSFTIRDEEDQDLYTVKGEIFTLGRKLHIYDMAGNEIALIKQKLLTLLPKYIVSGENFDPFTISQKLSVLVPNYSVEPMGWSVKGSITGHEFSLYSGSDIVASVSKAWISWGDSYEINIPNTENHMQALAIVLAIDCMRADADDAAIGAPGFNAG